MPALPTRLPTPTRRAIILLRVLALVLVPMILAALFALLVASEFESSVDAVRSAAIVTAR